MLEKMVDRVAAKVLAKIPETFDELADAVAADVTKRLSTTLELISEEVLKLRQIENELADIKEFVIYNRGYLETILIKTENASSGADEIKAELEHIDFTQEIKDAISKIDYLTSYLKLKRKNRKKGK